MIELTKNKRLILDANVLLAGVLAPQSKSRLVLEKIRASEIAGYVAENTITEVERVLARTAMWMRLNLSATFHQAIFSAGLIILPRISRTEGKKFSGVRGSGDRAIAAAAAKIGADICTNDLKDFRKCGQYGLTVITPQQLADDGVIDLNTVCPGILTTPSQGTIYVEISALQWAGMQHLTGTPYLFDIDRIGGCFFDQSSAAFVGFLDNGPRLSIPFGTIEAASLPLKIVMAYGSQLAMYVGTTHADSIATDNWLPSAVAAPIKTSICNDRLGANQIGGCVRLIYGVPYSVSRRAAINMITGATVNNPWERLSVIEMIRRSGIG